MPEGSKKEDAPKMLQALLEERFKLTTHPASAEHPRCDSATARAKWFINVCAVAVCDCPAARDSITSTRTLQKMAVCSS
jgi:hypothetical protein